MQKSLAEAWQNSKENSLWRNSFKIDVKFSEQLSLRAPLDACVLRFLQDEIVVNNKE